MTTATLDKEANRTKELEQVLTALAGKIDQAFDGELKKGEYNSENFRVNYWTERGKVMLEVIER